MQENESVNFSAVSFLQQQLSRRLELGLFRSLQTSGQLEDFSSNDYLGLSRNEKLKEEAEKEIQFLRSRGLPALGSGGSRLLAGNTDYAEMLESEIASYHGFESALLFNSGYDGNIGFFSAVPQRGDTILFDEHIHASVRDGIRLSTAQAHHFRHNDTAHLAQLIRKASGRVYVAVESVYSMDGMFCPLKEMAELCNETGAHLVVDEAHGVGVMGSRGEGRVSALGLQKNVFAVLYTFGKGLGCHGGLWAGPVVLRPFLINFARSFIYTTALPPGDLAVIRAAYRLLPELNGLRDELAEKIALMTGALDELVPGMRLPSTGPIQSVLIPGNSTVRAVAAAIRKRGYDVRPILSPTVKEGTERIRICIHAQNSAESISGLCTAISDAIREA